MPEMLSLPSTPMFRQYEKIKEDYPGCLVLFRVGDFYETYGGDAEVAARVLEIVLTSKDAGGGKRVPMAGVPHFALEQYLRTLVSAGHRVAICDQMEDARFAKGLLKREVVRVVTSGTIVDPEMLDSRSSNYILCVSASGKKIGIAVADASTGEFAVAEIENLPGELREALERWRPAEIILCEEARDLDDLRKFLDEEKIPQMLLEAPLGVQECDALLREHYHLGSLLGLGLPEFPQALSAAGNLLQYIKDTQKSESLSLRMPRLFRETDYLILDATTRRNLEIIETLLARERKGSLLWALDETQTSMGARLLRRWLERPLMDLDEIRRRHAMVQVFLDGYDRCLEVRKLLQPIQDIERLLSKAIYGTANARDLLALKSSLLCLSPLREILRSFGCADLDALAEEISPLEELLSLLQRSIRDDPPATLRDGEIIKAGFHQELDKLRLTRSQARQLIAQIEERERERTGIKSLRVGFNQVFGYYIEVTRPNLRLVPEDYIRKQTIATGERFISPELKEYEARVLGAEERIKTLEFELFQEVRRAVVAEQERIQRTADAIARTDVLSNFAFLAASRGYVCPEMHADDFIEIRGSRHPVIEKVRSDPFVPNDFYIDGQNERVLIVTGPNMAGKSTYLRQVALAAIMAQMGCFVPAKSARIGIVDRIFTRVGATDDLHLGQSTFLVEMIETANIINNASPRSLVLLDEIGRGTSTFDGLAIAWAVVEYLLQTVRSRTVFATHFHELTEIPKIYPGIKNYRVAVRETGEDVVFLHRILPGTSDRSYGIHVARLAGIPQAVLDRARDVLERFENEKKVQRKGAPSKTWTRSGEPPGQMFLFDFRTHPVLEEILSLNIAEMTPLQALNRIYEWQKRIDRDS